MVTDVVLVLLKDKVDELEDTLYLLLRLHKSQQSE